MLQQSQQFRRYPKNTWRLNRLQQRYIKLREEENNQDDMLAYSQSEQDLRNHLMTNFDYIISSTSLTENPSRYAQSVSSIPSLTSANTSSPSISVRSNFTDEEHHQHHHQFVTETNMEKS